MDLHQRLDALLALAESIGLALRREPLGGDGGGLCLLKGRRVLFVDTDADLDARYERTLTALADLTEWESQAIEREIREDLTRARKNSA